eukprot:GHVP01061565.1.p1 GENE.GHVP01061565.1~~GHVP01061565.1.p1  ORF type:complete len:669 (-),score=92.50 GHVP01061565.1:400-2406(-)
MFSHYRPIRALDTLLMNISISVISSTKPETSPSLLISIEKMKYMINCPENIQRSLIEGSYRIKQDSLGAIFLPTSFQSSSGGLLGFLMKYSDNESSSTNIIGNPLIEDYVKSSYPIFHRSTFSIHYDTNYKDRYMEVSSITTSRHMTSLIFTISSPARKFNKEKADKINLKPGPYIKELLKGGSIKTKEGLIVTPDDVLDPKIKPKVILYLYMNEINDLSAFIDNPSFKNIDHENCGIIVIEEISDSIRNSLIYKEFIKGFTRFKLNEGEDVVYRDYHEACLLNRDLCDSLSLDCNADLLNENFASKAEQSTQEIRTPLAVGCKEGTGCLYTLDTNTVLRIEPKMEIVLQEKSQQSSLEVLEKSNNESIQIPSNDSQITFLGTGAAIPSKYRNVSGILLTHSDKTILLDTGEGSNGQLRRMTHKAPSLYNEIISKLSMILITHSHLDHLNGAFPILLEYIGLSLNRKLNIIATDQTIMFISKVLTLWNIDYENILSFISPDPNIPFCCEDAVVHSVPVIHLEPSFGYIIETDTLLVSYSGDTRPCNGFIEKTNKLKEAFKTDKVSVLIHEATFTDDLVERAVNMKHSTLKEAVEVFKSIIPDICIFTHFSQRSTDDGFVDSILELEDSLKRRVFLAYDMFTLTLDKINRNQEKCFIDDVWLKLDSYLK